MSLHRHSDRRRGRHNRLVGKDEVATLVALGDVIVGGQRHLREARAMRSKILRAGRDQALFWLVISLIWLLVA